MVYSHVMYVFLRSRQLTFAAGFLLLAFALRAESPIVLKQAQIGKWQQVERANWSRYDNGSYTGLTHRETRAFLTAERLSGGGSRFTGHYYVLEETLRDMVKAARGVDAVEKASFVILPDGTTRPEDASPFPYLRNFPAFPAQPVSPGDRWQSEGIRVVDPRGDGKRSPLPIVVEYAFSGTEEYKGQTVYRIKAKYATRLNQYARPRGTDPDMKTATGTHDVDILVSADTGAVLLQLDRLDETFTYADGSTVRFRGNTATFGEIPAAMNAGELIAGIEAVRTPRADGIGPKAPGASGTTTPRRDESPSGAAAGTQRPSRKPVTPNADAVEDFVREGLPQSTETAPFTLDSTEQGLRLSVRDIRFRPDSDEILPEEAWRIDAIAKALSLATGATFLVEGHTASVGKPAGEKELSVNRAKRIVAELAARGLSEDRFLYAGHGGAKPVGDNATAAGRAQNRRVEITILE